MDPANCGKGRLKIRGKLLGCILLLVVLPGLADQREAHTADPRSSSATLASQSFALLDKLNKAGNKADPLVGLVAGFCGDAETLRQSLARGDLRAAGSAVAVLQTDRDALDQAFKAHPNPIALQDWSALGKQLDEVVREIPNCGVNCAPPPDDKSDQNLASGTGAARTGDAPRIVVASREYDKETVRLRGYFEGSDLKSAGIYDGADELKAFSVDGVPGRQKVEFDLRLRNPSTTTALRITDGNHRTTEAFVIADDGPELSSTPPSEESALAPSAGSTAVERPLNEGAAIAEIPSHGPLTPSPSNRHLLDGNLAGAKIDILAITQTRNLPPTYQVVGHIIGHGIIHAGIYLDGRLLEPIPIVTGASDTTFDREIIAHGGSPTVRAYGVGNRFIEQPLDFINAPNGSELADSRAGGLVPAVPISVPDIKIQITAVQKSAGNSYLVSGFIAGPDIAAAGLYQNGMLAQNIVVSAGLAGTLGALIPGISRSINFSARFNPYPGPVSVRAFNTKGAYTEQPVIVAGAVTYRALPLYSPYVGPGSLPGGSGLATTPNTGMVGSVFPPR
jgi:hypothetical protein